MYPLLISIFAAFILSAYSLLIAGNDKLALSSLEIDVVATSHLNYIKTSYAYARYSANEDTCRQWKGYFYDVILPERIQMTAIRGFTDSKNWVTYFYWNPGENLTEKPVDSGAYSSDMTYSNWVANCKDGYGLNFWHKREARVIYIYSTEILSTPIINSIYKNAPDRRRIARVLQGNLVFIYDGKKQPLPTALKNLKDGTLIFVGGTSGEAY